jgi:hypothetical protein
MTAKEKPTPVKVEKPELEVGQKPESQYDVARTSYVVQLPSKGRFYGDKLPDGNVEVYLMTAVEDKILADLTPDNIPEIFDSIISRCVKSEISSEEMIETDRYYLLLMLRSYSLGDDYKFELKCPDCSFAFVHTAHIPGDFEMIDGTATEEPFYVNLPMSKAKVGLRLLRGKDTKEINAKRLKVNADKGDPAYAFQNAKAIVSINDKPVTIAVAQTWFMALSLKDVRALQEAVSLAYPGIINRVTVPCTRCKFEILTRVPLSPLLFFV